MNDNRLPEAIIGRLSRVRTLESQLVDRLEELRTDTAIDRALAENFTRLLALAARFRSWVVIGTIVVVWQIVASAGMFLPIMLPK